MGFSNDSNSSRLAHLDNIFRGLGQEVDDALADGAQRCGNYTLVTQVGSGGYGDIFAAVSSEPSCRRVAIKILKRGLDTMAILRRFALEQRALAQIDHPSVVTIFDSGMTSDGRPWFAMPLLDGAPITSACDADDLTLSERLALFSECCAGVQAAHTKGIVHRDIKPGNLMVTKASDGSRSVRLIDFGIAKAVYPDAVNDPTLTGAHCALGTRAYMAPEQLEPMGVTDTRSDVYSLGVVLLELLTGAPHRDAGASCSRRVAARALVDSDGAMRAAHRCGFHTPRSHAQALRGDLDAIVAKAMMAAPSLRYQSAQALADDVARAMRHEPVLARERNTRYTLMRFVRRHRIAVALTCAVACALVAALALVTSFAVKAQVQSDRAQAAAERSDDVRRVLEGVMNGIGSAVARGRDPSLVSDLLRESTRRFLGQLPETDPMSAADIALVLGQSYLDLSEPHHAIDLFERVGGYVAESLHALPTDASEQSVRELQLAHARLAMLAARGRLDAEKSRNGLLSVVRVSRVTIAVLFAALDEFNAIDALDDHIALRGLVWIWLNQYHWTPLQPSATRIIPNSEPDHAALRAFEVWLAPRIAALPDSDPVKWQFLLRQAELGSWDTLIPRYRELMTVMMRARGATEHRVLESRTRFAMFQVAAAVESKEAPDPRGHLVFSAVERLAWWVRLAEESAQLVRDSTAELGEDHRTTRGARLAWMQASGYAMRQGRDGLIEPTAELLAAFDALRAETIAIEGNDSKALTQIDGALRGVREGESRGIWWK